MRAVEAPSSIGQVTFTGTPRGGGPIIAPVAVVGGAVLAAGSGTRMGAPKAELAVGGVRLIDRAVAALNDGGCVDVIAVVRLGVSVSGARVIVNQAPGRGQRSSLELAVAACDRTIDALAVLLVDTPGIGAVAVRTVVDQWLPGKIAVGLYGSRRAHPIVMALDLWRVAIALAGPDEGARKLMAKRENLVLEVACDGDPHDLDYPSDLET